MFNVKKIRQQFPILDQAIGGKPLVYLDSAATTQKPKCVIDVLQGYYTTTNAAIYRGVHALSEKATAAYENARVTVQQFINAQASCEIIFVRNSTEAINLVATCLGVNFNANDEIIITALEHHSNIVPWQMLCEKTGAKLKIVPIFDDGRIDFAEYKLMLNKRVKLVAIAHVSNALGNILPAKEMVDLAHVQKIPVLVDGAQAVAHLSVDVQDLGCDFYVFSGHKMYAPDGIGVLYGKAALLEKMPPYQGGGGMIETVGFARTTYLGIPQKFEAGTPNVSGAVGLARAIDFLNAIGKTQIFAYEEQLLDYLLRSLATIAAVKVLGCNPRVGLVSLVLPQIHPHDVGTILNNDGIAVRAGHHCAMPLMQRLGISATTRVSLGMYNTTYEIDVLLAAMKKVLVFFGKV